jgi:glycosyltransferase involved in cell wall biosynthesis
MPNEPTTTDNAPRADHPGGRTFVVMAAYNEAAVIADVVRGLRQAYEHVVVIDDGSSDGTFDAVRPVAAWALRHAVNRGQGAALQTGIRFALAQGADYIVTFDADGQHRVEDIQRLLAPLQAGQAEIALGSRFLGSTEGMPTSRRWLLRMSVLFTRVVSGVRISDAHNGLRAFSRKAAERIDITLDRMAHASELIEFVGRCGLPFVEVPVCIRYTDYSLHKGQSARGAVRIVLHFLLKKVLG